MTPLKAVRKFCLDCVGGIQKEVTECNNPPGSEFECLLHPFRFGRNLKSKRLTLKIIKNQCSWCLNGYPKKDCLSPECALFPYRSGHNPKLKGKVCFQGKK